MNTIRIKKFGLAVGATWALLYIGCAVLMMVAGKDGTALFFNSLLHGLDTSSIVRMGVPLSEFLIGLVGSFVIGWLAGACTAGIYNFSMTKRTN
ncbi:MAG TPA: hypothetical protein ENJ95_09330 [Bacteroidetes bacterium]|nr:hypothetical protein [Bacteroidota bacterium]